MGYSWNPGPNKGLLRQLSSSRKSCKHRPAPSSQREALEVNRLLKRRPNVTLEWCPGHQGVTGNEQADAAVRSATKAAAKQAAPTPLVRPTTRPTVAWVKAQAKAKKEKEIVEAWWCNNDPDSYTKLGLGPYPDTHGLSRVEMAKLVVYRTGHRKFATHFRRFNIKAEEPTCHCGAVVVPEHLTQRPRRRKVVYEAKEKYKLETEEGVHGFFLGKGHKGVGAKIE